MKRILTCILVLMTVLALSMPAYADIMWEPSDNSFYDDHRDECKYEDRAYYANGQNGFVTMVSAPGGSMLKGQYENGEILWVGYTYGRDGGDIWALVERWEDDKENSGWIRMSDLSLVYDYICFAEEYGDRITDYNGEFADYDGDAEAVNFYKYPGAPEIDQTFAFSNSWGGDILGNLTGTSENPSYIHSIFVDEDGRTWGFVSYMYGYRNAWFCLDEPDGENFPIREVSTANLTPAQEPVLPAASYVPYILVAAAVAATGALLVIFYGKRKKSTD